MFRKLRQEYRLGKKYSGIVENIFQFGHKLTPDNSTHLYPVEKWELQKKRLKMFRDKMTLLGKIIFELGDENVVFDLHHPKFTTLEKPLRICADGVYF